MPKNTKYAKQNAKYAKKHQIRQKTPTTPKFSFMLICCEKKPNMPKKHQVRQAKRRVRQKTPNTSKNSNCAKIFIYADLSRNFFFFQFYATFGVPFTGLKIMVVYQKRQIWGMARRRTRMFELFWACWVVSLVFLELFLGRWNNSSEPCFQLSFL